jgi:hypothetical protein
MIAIIPIVVFFFFLLFTSSAYAQGYGHKLCKNDARFSCYVVKSGDHWEKLFPDQTQRDLIMRVNRTNNRLHTSMVIAIPKNLTTSDKMSLSPFSKQISAPGGKLILVSIDQLAWGAYDAQGTLLNWGPISAGKGYCPDIDSRCGTPRGNFTIYNKGGAGCVSSKFPIGRGGAPMPYCMFFHGGFALHGSYDVPGYNASHGCVRLFVNDANWLNKEFTPHETVRVTIY